jgi:hypothetical protein
MKSNEEIIRRNFMLGLINKNNFQQALSLVKESDVLNPKGWFKTKDNLIYNYSWENESLIYFSKNKINAQSLTIKQLILKYNLDIRQFLLKTFKIDEFYSNKPNDFVSDFDNIAKAQYHLEKINLI